VSTINQVYEFGASADPSNILSNAAYGADAGRVSGHEPGIARQELENAVLRNLSRFAKGVAAWIASHYAPGVVDDGDDAKIAAGLAAAVAAVAPAPAQATTTAQGIVELATSAEAIAGTDTERAITPAALAAALAANSSGTSFGTALILSRVGR
jgi:hypothetical protein